MVSSCLLCGHSLPPVRATKTRQEYSWVYEIRVASPTPRLLYLGQEIMDSGRFQAASLVPSVEQSTPSPGQLRLPSVEHPEIIPDLSNDSGDSTARNDPLPNLDAAKYYHTMSDDTTVIAHAPSSTSSPSNELPAAGASSIGQRKPRVLVVDDNSANLTHSINFMKKRNLTVLDAADNGKIAVGVVEGTLQGYDLILMDLSMPVMDRFEATRSIRAIEKERNDCVPPTIIAFTGREP